MGERVFKTLDQQLDILISRGVKIKEEDKESAKDFLLKNNSHLFGFILELKRILPCDDYGKLKASIIDLSNKYPFVGMKYYGFCEDWENLI